MITSLKEMLTDKEILPSVPQEMYSEKYGEYAY